ncbi:MAG: hypothetical protein ACO3LT_09540 [Ilumatobacteraceae bacterium]
MAKSPNNNGNGNGNGNGDGKRRRGRAKGSTTPVTLQVNVTCGDADRMALRAENAIDDGSATVGCVVKTTETGFAMTLTAKDGGNGRIARASIAKTLKKWHAKGKITSALILTNPIRIGG